MNVNMPYFASTLYNIKSSKMLVKRFCLWGVFFSFFSYRVAAVFFYAGKLVNIHYIIHKNN